MDDPTSAPSGPTDDELDDRLTTLGRLPVPEAPAVGALTSVVLADDGPGRRSTDAAAGGDASTGRVPIGDGSAATRSGRLWLVSAAAAAVVLALVGVLALRARTGDTIAGPGGTEVSSSALDGRTFESTSITEGGRPRVLVPDALGAARVNVRFVGGRVVISAGCNGIHGDYEIEAGRLVVGGTVTTQMGCTPALHDQDGWLQRFLTSSPALELDGDRLTMTSGETVIVLEDVAAAGDLPLEGTRWELATIVDGEVTSSPDPSGSWIRFSGDPAAGPLTFEGEMSCNSIGGTVAVEGSTFGPVERFSSAVGCGTSDDGPTFDAVFGVGATFAIEGSTLTVTRGDRALVFEAAAEPDTTTTTGPAMDGLRYRRWELVAVIEGGARRPLDLTEDERSSVFVQMGDVDGDDDPLAGGDGCRRFRGTVTVGPDELVFGPLEGAAPSCTSDELVQVSDVVARVLSGTATYRIEGDELTITNGDDALVLRATADDGVPGSTADGGAEADSPLVGTRWELVSITEGSVTTIDIPATDGVHPFMTFREDPVSRHTVSGFDGCNGFSGPVTIDLGDRERLSMGFGPLAQDQRACADPVRARVAGAVHEALTLTWYEIDGDELTLTRDTGELELVLVFRAAGAVEPIVPDPDAGGTVPSTVARGFWTSYEVAADDRTLTFQLACAFTGAERLERVDVIPAGVELEVAAMVRVPSGAVEPCTPGTRSFVVVLDQPLAGRAVVQRTGPSPLPPL